MTSPMTRISILGRMRVRIRDRERPELLATDADILTFGQISHPGGIVLGIDDDQLVVEVVGEMLLLGAARLAKTNLTK